jgi:hypothetical protein
MDNSGMLCDVQLTTSIILVYEMGIRNEPSKVVAGAARGYYHYVCTFLRLPWVSKARSLASLRFCLSCYHICQLNNREFQTVRAPISGLYAIRVSLNKRKTAIRISTILFPSLFA